MSEITGRWHFDGATAVRERVQDVEAIIEHNKRLQTIEQKSDWGRHIASIPLIFMEKWLNEEYARGNVNLRLFTKQFDQEVVAKKLRDPEFAYLRVDNPSNPFHSGWRK